MRIALLSGAYGNAGDSLIEARSRALLENTFPGGAEVKVYSRKRLAEDFEEINACDLVVFSGGPIYQRDIRANFDVAAACRITAPLKIIGGGWKGASRSQMLPYRYAFEPDTRRLFEKIDGNGGLSCRDLFSVKALRAAGFESAVMTGCPAWYDLERVHELRLRPYDGERPVICVSDPAVRRNEVFVEPLLRYLHGAFPASQIKYVLHRGRQTADYESKRRSVEALGFAELVELTPSAEAFAVYDECDLHVGFRVHAHIYRLSRRQRSVLIEEDGRGGGVNEALGLPALPAYSDEVQSENRWLRKGAQLVGADRNEFLLRQLEDYLTTVGNTVYYENAFRLMASYYERMLAFLTGNE